MKIRITPRFNDYDEWCKNDVWFYIDNQWVNVPFSPDLIDLSYEFDVDQVLEFIEKQRTKQSE